MYYVMTAQGLEERGTQAEYNYEWAIPFITDARDAVENLLCDIEELPCSDDTYFALYALIEEETYEIMRSDDCLDFYDTENTQELIALAEEICEWCKNFYKTYEHLIYEI